MRVVYQLLRQARSEHTFVRSDVPEYPCLRRVRALIQERVKAGLRNARAKGKKFGRRRAQVDADQVAELRRTGFPGPRYAGPSI